MTRIVLNCLQNCFTGWLIQCLKPKTTPTHVFRGWIPNSNAKFTNSLGLKMISLSKVEEVCFNNSIWPNKYWREELSCVHELVIMEEMNKHLLIDGSLLFVKLIIIYLRLNSCTKQAWRTRKVFDYPWDTSID